MQLGQDLLQALVPEQGVVGGNPGEGLLGESELCLEGRHGWAPWVVFRALDCVFALGASTGALRWRTSWSYRAVR